MQINELVTFAADVGRGLLESGAETSRVEDTVERIIRHFYDGKSEVLRDMLVEEDLDDFHRVANEGARSVDKELATRRCPSSN